MGEADGMGLVAMNQVTGLVAARGWHTPGFEYSARTHLYREVRT